MVKRKKSFKNKRPIAVIVIATAIVVLFVIRLYQVFEPLIRQQVFQEGIRGALVAGYRLTPLGGALFSSVSYLVLSIAGIVVLIGFLRLRRWSWVLLMGWTGISLVISLVDYFYSRANFVVMASNVIIAFALNLNDVQRIYQIRSEDVGPVL
jgi:hypothetical protein